MKKCLSILIALFSFTLVIISISCSGKKPIKPGETKPISAKIQTNDKKQLDVFCLYTVPGSYSADSDWPVLIALHGDGANARAFHDLWLPVTDSLHVVLLTPQGENKGENNLHWFWGENSFKSIQACFDILREDVNIDLERVYIAGFSAGAKLAFEMAAAYPSIFSGTILCSTPFHQIKGVLKDYPGLDQKIYIGHGALEKNIDHARDFVQNKKDNLHLKYVEFDSTGHGIPKPIEKELGKALDFILLD